jgi:hypothetical protein
MDPDRNRFANCPKVRERQHQNPDIKKKPAKKYISIQWGECSKLILVVIEFHLVFPFS